MVIVGVTVGLGVEEAERDGVIVGVRVTDGVGVIEVVIVGVIEGVIVTLGVGVGVSITTSAIAHLDCLLESLLSTTNKVSYVPKLA